MGETVGGDAGEGEPVGGASPRSEEEGWKWAATLLSERRAPATLEVFVERGVKIAVVERGVGPTDSVYAPIVGHTYIL